jgi:glutamate-1-semialdehyde aminotransferase
MYAVMLARAFTGRDLVLKAAGGWHGAQPWGLKGVYFLAGPQHWGADSEGLPEHVMDEVAITLFNDVDELTEQFRRHGERIACLIVEPFAGAGNFQVAAPEYLAAARELSERHGALLVFDEVISGFRFCAGDLGSLYGIRADLATFGKIIGGGMPVAAVAGRGDVMALCGREGGSRVAFLGGTFSAHPASLLASRSMVSHLVEHEDDRTPPGRHFDHSTHGPERVLRCALLASRDERIDDDRDAVSFGVVTQQRVEAAGDLDGAADDIDHRCERGRARSVAPPCEQLGGVLHGGAKLVEQP